MKKAFEMGLGALTTWFAWAINESFCGGNGRRRIREEKGVGYRIEILKVVRILLTK